MYSVSVLKHNSSLVFICFGTGTTDNQPALENEQPADKNWGRGVGSHAGQFSTVKRRTEVKRTEEE